MIRIGLISDTHNQVRPQALAFLRGSDHIIHAGDICQASVLDELRALAPVTAVRGNNDRGAWAQALNETEVVEVGEIGIFVIHDLSQLASYPLPAGLRIVVSGHSHKPSVAEKAGIRYVNPGSAGPRRFSLPVSAGEILIDGGWISARTVDLLAIQS